MRHSVTLLALTIGGFLLAVSMRQATRQEEIKPPSSLYDPRLGELRRALTKWNQKPGPVRKVIDQVALVPDVATYLEAIATWDDAYFYPILIDDAELTTKFIREFKPARIIRFPGRLKGSEGKALWKNAVNAVGRGWTRELPNPPEPPLISSTPSSDPALAFETEKAKGQRGDFVPSWLLTRPPGVVVSHPASPSLAGAVALAAGRFQPLLFWDPKPPKSNGLNDEEARQLCHAFEKQLAVLVKDYNLFSDECDFITLAAPYPDRYLMSGGGPKNGLASFDDLMGRNQETLRRWAYVGRLTGGASESVYRAMCSLFLQPKSVLLFDGYDDPAADFQAFTMRLASMKMPADLRSTLVIGPKADLKGWQRAVEPFNEFDFVYVNTSGQPTNFNLANHTLAYSADIPATVPAIVVMNHSFSAAAPDDPNSIAGTWLSGGAYIYFGAMNEPYLQAFRTPSLVASLLTEGIPIIAALRMGSDENPAFGTPWRLHFLGDPLFRIDPVSARAPRWPSLDLTDSWPSYIEEPVPPATATAVTKLAWAAKMTILDAAKKDEGPPRKSLETTLLAVSRNELPANMRVVLDGLRIDAMPRSRDHASEFLAALAAVPSTEASSRVTQTVLAAKFAKFRRSVERSEWSASLALWGDIERSPAPDDLKDFATKTVGGIASRSGNPITWKVQLESRLKGRETLPETRHLREELARIQKEPNKSSTPSTRR